MRARDRGAALLLVFFMAIVFFILVGSMIDLAYMEFHAAGSSAQSSQALTAAYAGIDKQILTIEEFYVNGTAQGTPGNAPPYLFPNESGGTQQSGYNAEITQTFDDTRSGIRYFLIHSDGFVQDGLGVRLDKQLSALVRQVPFGQYSQFTANEVSNTGGDIWYTNPQSYQGLVYSGGPMHIMYTPGYTTPIFPLGFQTAAKPNYVNAATGANGYPSPANVGAVFGGGAQAECCQQQQLPGMSQNLVVFSEAFNGDDAHNDINTFTTETQSLAPGVYVNGQIPGGGNNVPLQTGIFIEGDADLSASAPQGSNTETFTFGPPSAPDKTGLPLTSTTVVAIDFSTNQTTVTENGSTTTYNGVPSGEATVESGGNGAIFENGSVTVEPNSVVHGQYTVALPDPPTDDQTMTLQGSIVYQTEPNPAQDIMSNDELALWANDIILNDQSNGSIEIDGMMMTGFVNECGSGACKDGAFYNAGCKATVCDGGIGPDITLFGGLIENIRGKLGEVDANGDVVGGFLRTAIYDPRLGADPPPFSPTTNDYNVVAITDDDPLAL